MQIAVVAGDPPGATAPRNSAAARELALQHGAAAVVWVSEHELGHAIWVYEAATDQLLARPLEGALPFDSPTAAAVALSIKTLLRHSATAPATERFGATQPPAAESRSAQPAPAAPQARPPGGSADTAEVDSAADAAPASSRLDFEALAGLRFGLTQPSETEARLGASALVFPGGGALGVGLRAAFGPGLHAAAAGFDGQLFDVAPGVLGRARLPLSRAVTLAAGAGATAHVTVLDGTLAGAAGDAVAIDGVLRLVPALDLELLGEVRLGSFLRLGARAGVSFWLRPQRYQVAERTALELSRTAFEAGLLAIAGLPD